jgi:hypothetical protein
VDDLKYKEYFKKRKKLIAEWYSKKKFKKNLLRIIKQIEERTKSNFPKRTVKKILERYKAK